MVVTWNMFEAVKNWWQAIDNIEITTDAYAVDPKDAFTTTWGELSRGIPLNSWGCLSS